MSDHNPMFWTYLGKPARRPDSINRRWRMKDLAWSSFKQALRKVELGDYDSPSEGVDLISSVLKRLCRDHQKGLKLRKRKSAPWFTKELMVQRSKLHALKRLFRRTMEPIQRGRYKSLFKRRRAVYKRAIL